YEEVLGNSYDSGVANTGAVAWGQQGHMMVAAIAWKKLTPSVRVEVSRLLKQNPNYDLWVEGADAAEADEIAFITAATWPDFIKGADGYKNDGEPRQDPMLPTILAMKISCSTGIGTISIRRSLLDLGFRSTDGGSLHVSTPRASLR
ncbi:MAG TPA: S1/P1 nuclease, partial [Bryobacteraceae bacterium]|nr:S1/P1 nuclease [Bryobacteraceae bacterium]